MTYPRHFAQNWWKCTKHQGSRNLEQNQFKHQSQFGRKTPIVTFAVAVNDFHYNGSDPSGGRNHEFKWVLMGKGNHIVSR